MLCSFCCELFRPKRSRETKTIRWPENRLSCRRRCFSLFCSSLTVIVVVVVVISALHPLAHLHKKQKETETKREKIVLELQKERESESGRQMALLSRSRWKCMCAHRVPHCAFNCVRTTHSTKHTQSQCMQQQQFVILFYFYFFLSRCCCCCCCESRAARTLLFGQRWVRIESGAKWKIKSAANKSTNINRTTFAARNQPTQTQTQTQKAKYSHKI